ncbi:MAG: hypothetical protein ACLQAH_05095 [Limisphaerales bacterium]
MKKISREKRNQLIIVALVTLAVLGLIYFGLIQPQYDSLNKIAKAKKTADNKLVSIKNTITNATVVANDLSEVTATLAHTEEDMASGDLYSWTYDTIRRFKQQYQVEIPEVGHPAVSDVDVLPAFPYKQIRFSINGTAYYHDMGKFIAGFENNFPHARMVNLIIEPMPTADSSSEKLSFKMDIVALVKPNPS